MRCNEGRERLTEVAGGLLRCNGGRERLMGEEGGLWRKREAYEDRGTPTDGEVFLWR